MNAKMIATSAIVAVAPAAIYLATVDPIDEPKTQPPPLISNGTPPPVPRQEVAQAPREPLATRIERLTASGQPADALAAHEIVFRCVMVEEISRRTSMPVPSELQACESLQQWQKDGRFANLDVALKADVPGSGMAYYREGPRGVSEELARTQPNDPRVVAWKEQAVAYVKRDALRGDVAALAAMADIYANLNDLQITKPDPKEALAWQVAMWQARSQSRPVVEEARERDLARLSRGMAEADVKAAKARGAEIAAQCCSSSALSPAGGQK